MKRIVVVLGLLLLAATVASAQTDGPTNAGKFSITANAVALPGGGQTVAATDVGGTFAVTNHLSFRSDNLLAPANDLQGYFGGVQYFLPTAKLLKKTTLNAKSFQFYLTGSVGVERIVPATGPNKQHIGVLAGGGANFDPTGSGKFSLNLFEVRYARLPGIAQNTAIVSSGLTLTF